MNGGLCSKSLIIFFFIAVLNYPIERPQYRKILNSVNSDSDNYDSVFWVPRLASALL